MYTIKFTGEFKRQMKMCERRGYDMLTGGLSPCERGKLSYCAVATPFTPKTAGHSAHSAYSAALRGDNLPLSPNKVRLLTGCSQGDQAHVTVAVAILQIANQSAAKS